MKRYPSVKNVILLCIVFTVLQLLAGLLTESVLFILKVTGLNSPDEIRILLTIAATVAMYLLIFRSLHKKKYVPALYFHKLNRITPYSAVLFLILFAGCSILLSELNNVFYYFLPMPDFLVNLFNSAFFLESFYLSLIMLVLVPSVCEEILFRGFILFGLRRHYSARKSILVSSLLFAAVHLNPWQFVSAFLIGLVFGWIALKTKSLILPVAGHFINNLTALIASRFFGMEMNPGPDFEMQPFWLNLSGILLLSAGAWFLLKYFKLRKLEKVHK